ncbi:hypothetical protein TL16_g01768 [Triparma laevis f. inornata]|uniref:Co-chaperone HscB C-terminal oligomerisation domain-containing protein n=2 Tax=Triparma laevis TaxID=1534972 RepID=A0A9W7FKV8_9STRA|nr:hypothetical protein TL16_g01768 [Triparma laevis f. inornata]GMI14422.1 hypothetical protein TrLO_g2431 [Triparma laevis f. longispina]
MYMTSYIKNGEDVQDVREGVLEEVMSLRFSLEDLENSEIEKKKKQIAERIEELKEEINREYDEKEEKEIDIKVCVEIANEGVFYYRCLERVKDIE